MINTKYNILSNSTSCYLKKCFKRWFELGPQQDIINDKCLQTEFKEFEPALDPAELSTAGSYLSHRFKLTSLIFSFESVIKDLNWQ